MTAEKARSLEEIAGPVSRETIERLLDFESVFQKWASRINLAASSTLIDMWSRHILDSAQLICLAPDARRWLDLGSGGGFPGLVMAFLLRDKAGAHVDLVESSRKKAGFLQAMVGQFGLPAQVHPGRIEQLRGRIVEPDVVTARALAPLAPLLELAEPWLARQSVGLFHKGRDYGREVEESAHQWSLDLVEHRSKVDPQGVILEIRNLRRSYRTPE